MGRPRITDGPPISLRVPAELRARLEALQATMLPGLTVDLSQVLRRALEIGVAEIEASSAKGFKVAP